MILFFVVATAIWIAGHYYIGRRLIPRARVGVAVKRGAWALLVGFMTLPLAAFFSARLGATFTGFESLQWIGLWMLGVSSVVLVLLLASELVRGISAGFRRFLSRPQEGNVEDPQRRDFFGRVVNGAVLASAGTTGGVGLAQATQTAGVVEVDVPIAGLPAALDGFTIVQLTDIHVGPTIKGDDLRGMVERANACGGDLIAVTGDLIDGFVDQIGDQVAPLGELDAPHGVYFVTGNHEYYWGAPQWCEFVASLGIDVLNNEHRVVEREGAKLLLAGVTDVRAGDHIASHASSPKQAREGAPDCDVSVLLAHQPRSIYDAADAGYDLQISGHTHGGQYFPMNILVYLAQPYVAGLHRHGDTQIYVSRGTGYWGPPIRFGAPHEITKIRLRTA